MNQKIAVERIKIEVWGGDPIPDDFQPAGYDKLTGEPLAEGWGVFKDWIAAGLYIRKLAHDAPIGGAYDKRNFVVKWEDDHEHSGRLDVQHLTMPYPDNDNDLAAHVWGHLTFYTGERKPDHMDEERYTDYLVGVENRYPGNRQNHIDILATYDIPETDGLTPADELTYCQNCGATFIIDNGLLCGRCQSDKDEKDRAAAEAKAKHERDTADPLYGIAHGPGRSRSDVTKKMRQLLKARSGKAWSVTGDRGTAWGWLNIQAPPKRRIGEYGRTSDEDARELADLLGLDRPDGNVSVPSGEWFHYLKACRGDFSDGRNWRDNYYIHPIHECYIMNSLTEEPKTADRLLEEWPEYNNKLGEYSPSFNHCMGDALHVLCYRSELFQLGDKYTTVLTDKPTEATEAEAAPEIETAEDETAETLPGDVEVKRFSRPAGFGWVWCFGFEREWSWLAIETHPDPGDTIALAALGFRWSKRRQAFYAPKRIDREVVAKALNVS
jgi:hypothetical protein